MCVAAELPAKKQQQTNKTVTPKTITTLSFDMIGWSTLCVYLLSHTNYPKGLHSNLNDQLMTYAYFRWKYNSYT